MSHLSCLTILLIDDCAEERVELCHFLQQDSLYTYRIVEFETATPALKWCQQEIPDVIVLDLLLPDGDGLKFIQQFRECHSYTQTAVIMLTGQGDEVIAWTAMKSGIQNYLVKEQLTAEILQGAIHHAVERMQLTRELEQSREQQQLIAAIALRIRQSLKLEEILRTTATEVRQFLKADRVVVYQFQPDMSGTIVAESVLPGWTVAQFEVKANLVVPILIKEQLWGLLIAHQCSASRHWESVELDLLDRLAVQIAIAIQQGSAYQQAQAELAESQRAEAALIASEEKLKLTLNFAGISYWEWNPITNQLFASENAIHCFYSDPSYANLTSEQWLNLIHPEDRAWVEEEFRQAIATQTDYAAEYRVVWQDRSIHWLSVKGRGVYDASGQLLQMLGVLMDITERKLSEEERRRAQMLQIELPLLEDILETAQAGYWDWNIQDNQGYFSPTLKRMFGYEAHELANLSESLLHLIFPEDLPEILESFHQHFKTCGQIPYYNEVRYRHKDGSSVWAICSGRIIEWDKDGNPLRIIGCNIDITERKQLEAELLAIANLQQAILDGSDYAIIFNNYDGIQIFNAAAQKMLGYTANEVVGQIPTIFHDPEELKQRAAELSLALGREIAPGKDFFITVTQQQSSYENEWTYIRKDGSRFPVLLSVKTLYDLKGKNIGFLGIAKDITQQKLIEAQFRKNAAHLATAQRIAHLGSWEFDFHTQELIWSEEVFRIFGRDPASGTPTYQEFYQSIHPNDRQIHDVLVQQTIKQGKFYEEEYRSYRPDGNLIYLLSKDEAIFDTDGRPIQLVGTLLDITAHKQAEEALRDSERRYATLAQAAPVAIFRLDAFGNCIYINDRWSEMTGRPTEAALGMGWIQAFHPEDRDRLGRELSLKFEQKYGDRRKFYQSEGRHLRPDGSINWFCIQILPETNPFGNIIGYISTLTDITARKQAEEALKESERRYATLAQAAPVGIFRLDNAGNCIYTNDRWSEMTGRSTKAVLGIGWAETLHPEDRDRILREWHEAKLGQTGLFWNEGRLLRPDGTIKWFYCCIQPETNASGTVSGYIGTLTDISIRKQVEEQLHYLSERLTIAISSGGFGIWEYDFVQTKLIWDDRMYELHGVSKTDFNGSFDEWLNCLHPDDRPYILATIEQVLQGKQEYNVEFRIVEPSGKIRFLKGYGILKRDAQGEPVRMIGVNFDITDRKQAEQELMHNRDLREAIFNESADAIFLVDPQILLTLDCNRRAVEMFEAGNKAELIKINGQTLQRHPFTASETDAIVKDMQSKGVWSREIEYVTLQGRIFWGNIAAKPITVAGRTMHLVRIADISDRKQAQEALAKYAHEVEDLYNNAPCGYHSLDSEGRLLKVNETELQWLGYTREEMIGQPLLNFFTPASRLAFAQNYPHFKEQSWVKDLEYDMLCKDGTVLPVLISATAVKDVGGNYLYNRATLFDIRERKQTAQELEESRKMLQTVLDTFPQRVFWKDCQSRFIGCNPAFIRHSQLTIDEIIGKTDFELPWAKMAHLYCADDAMVMNTRTPKLGYEEPLEGHNGEQLWLRTNKVPLTNSAGEVIGVLVSHEDITERKQAEAQLRQTNEQLANANVELARATRLKDEFLANMSHELRTPLNAILGMSEGLQESVFGSINARQAKAIATIERSGRHLLELINDILDLSKIESGKLELQLSDVSVKNLCDISLAFVKQMALKKNIRLSTHISDKIDCIQVDDRRLRQVLINLLSNAVKFTPERGSVKLEVRLEGAGEAGGAGGAGGAGEVNSPLSSSSLNLCFYVTDTGIGIAPEEIGKLFQPFIQLDSSLNRQYSGTGLGLALVQKIVNLHGGTVLVSSEVGKGSCFTVRIPYCTSGNVLRTQVTTSLPSYPLLAENAQVLIIEDSVAAADQITRYLREMGMQSTTYPQGEGAVEEVLRVQPALIILDLQLPNLSGWEVLNQLKTNPKTKDIPAIIISVVDEHSKGLAQGAFEYLVKPITRAQLQVIIEKLQHPARSEESNLIVVPEVWLDTPLILLAEDNQANIDTMSGYLESRGYHLLLANNGQQAIDLVRVQRPDLIVMDIQMPGMDGLEAMRRIREEQQFVHIPMIALTALAMPGDRETCLAAGANEYLTKPVKLKQLVTTIQQLLGR